MTMVIGVKDDENKFDMMVSETINIALDMCLNICTICPQLIVIAYFHCPLIGSQLRCS